VIFETYPTLGYNYRMTDIQAAVGREQLKRLRASSRDAENWLSITGRFLRMLMAWDCRLNRAVPGPNWQSFCVRLPHHCDQRAVMQSMLDVVSLRGEASCGSHREPAYRDSPLRWSLPNSEEAQDRCIVLPMYPQMTDDDVVTMASALRHACERR